MTTATHRQVVVGTGIQSVNIRIPSHAPGSLVKETAIKAGLPIEREWQLQGHNANGSNRVIGDSDVPWQSVFTVIPINDNA